MKLFSETQRFTQLWFVIFLTIVNVVVLVSLSKNYEALKESGDLAGFWVPLAVILLVDLLFVFLRLETRYDENGITYRMFPFHFKERFVPWKDLKDCYVRKYSPITEYGGWGIRGLSKKTGKGMALNIKGDQGVQLLFKDGGKLLLGTQEPEKVSSVIETYRNRFKKENVVENG